GGSPWSAPARRATPRSTTTAGSAPPPPRAASITREGAPRGRLGRARPRRARPGGRDPGRPERERLGAGGGAGRFRRGHGPGAGTAGARLARGRAADPGLRLRAHPGPAAPGARLLLTQSDATAEQAAAVTGELRRIVAGMRLAQLHEPDEHPAQLVSKQLAAIAGGAQTLEGIAKAGVVLAQQFTQRGAAIVLQGIGPASGTLRIVAVSTAADSRLQGLVLPPAAPAVRAVTSGVPVVPRGAE